MTGEIKRGPLIWELAIVTASLLAISHILFIFRSVAWVGSSISTVVAILFLYVPVIVLWKRGRRIDFLDRDLRSFLRSLLAFVIAMVVIFPPFLLAAHYWQLWVFGKHAFKAAAYPNLLNACVFQLLLVALPEEFYFRGYFQSAMDIVCKKRVRFLGVNVGWGLLVTAVVFAISHTIVSYQWWHFSIFFPALLFGYLRLLTGSITAPVLFHVASNVIMDWFARSYS